MTKKWLDDVAASSLGYREALEQTYIIAQSLIDQEIPGDFVECGVFAGAHCAVMAKALQGPLQESRKIHLFDSFEGLPAADERDQEIWAHHGAKTGEAACSMALVAANMQRWGIPDSILVYHRGWFSDTVPAAVDAIRFGKYCDGSRVDSRGTCFHDNPHSGRLADSKNRFHCPVCQFTGTVRDASVSQIALLRLDADLYSSTKTCLEHLYPQVVRGGWVIVDDWNLSGCRQAVNEIVVPAPICWRTPTK
jgi:O-methyltransferase